jgi:hypothetical protein
MSNQEKHVNPDALTGEPGSHPIGTTLGTVGAASVGAMIGSAVGPVGTATGAIIGAVLGGVIGGNAGKDIAEVVNPTVPGLEANWREHHLDSFYGQEQTYESRMDAYQYGYNARELYPNRNFHEIKDDLVSQWNSNNPTNALEWERVCDAVEHAYENQTISG